MVLTHGQQACGGGRRGRDRSRQRDRPGHGGGLRRRGRHRDLRRRRRRRGREDRRPLRRAGWNGAGRALRRHRRRRRDRPGRAHRAGRRPRQQRRRRHDRPLRRHDGRRLALDPLGQPRRRRPRLRRLRAGDGRPALGPGRQRVFRAGLHDAGHRGRLRGHQGRRAGAVPLPPGRLGALRRGRDRRLPRVCQYADRRLHPLPRGPGRRPHPEPHRADLPPGPSARGRRSGDRDRRRAQPGRGAGRLGGPPRLAPATRCTAGGPGPPGPTGPPVSLNLNSNVNRRAARRLGAAAGLAVVGPAPAGAVVAAGRRWRAADDPCAGYALDLDGATPLKVERPDGAVLDGVVVDPESGHTVVLSHCWTGTRATWEPVAARLVARGCRVVLYDQRGHGASTMGTGALTVDHLGDDLAAVLEAVDAHDAVLAGHSMGGMALQALAVGRPDVVAEGVKAMVLAGTAGFGVAAGPLSAPVRFVTGDRRVERLMAGRLGPVLSRGAVGRHPRHAHLVATRDAWMSLPTDVRRQFLIALQAIDFPAGLAGVAVPTTVVVGSRDLLTPPRLARGIANAVPGARLVEVPGAGHMLPYEEPDLLAEIILAAATKEGDPS